MLDFLYNFCFQTFLTLRRAQWGIIKHIYWSSCKAPIIHGGFSKNNEISNFISVQLEPVVPWGRTDIFKWQSLFPHFPKAPTNVQCRNRPCFLITCTSDSHRMMQDTLRFRQHQIRIVVSRCDLAPGSPPIKSVVRVPKSSNQTGLFGATNSRFPKD